MYVSASETVSIEEEGDGRFGGRERCARGEREEGCGRRTREHRPVQGQQSPLAKVARTRRIRGVPKPHM